MCRGVAVMAPLLTLLILLLSRCSPAMGAPRYGERWEEVEGKGGDGGGGDPPGPGRGLFVLDKLEKVVESEGGRVHVVRGQPWPLAPSILPPNPWQSRGWSAGCGACREGLMHIGFITMEPKTLFVPQYIDSNLILFVQRGEVKVGWIYKDELVERELKNGDVLQIDAGSTFYMVNTGENQRLRIICSIDASDSIGFSPYQSFFLGGAGYPTSVIAGFDRKTLATAFNATWEELARILLAETRGPIVFYNMEPGGKEHGQGDKGPWRPRGRGDEEECGNDEQSTWSWRKLMGRFIGGDSDVSQLNKEEDKTPVSAPEPYNLYDHEPSFQNDYGWSISVDEHDYEPLDHSNFGVYLVNLTAGSMMAPHVNPRATEYGVVLGGEGTIEVVFPNGSLAMSAPVRAGDVFWIPRYFPFCQVASRGGPFEFFGFTTSARRNRPQFLIGAASVLSTMLGPELAAGFGVPEKQLSELVQAQKQEVILPPLPEREPLVIKQVAKE